MNFTCVVPTSFDPVAILWSQESSPMVTRVMLSRPGFPAPDEVARLYPDAIGSSCREIDALADDIRAFLSGKDATFSPDLVDWSRCTVFQESVLRAEHRIPRGHVSTYRLIARYLGREKGARAVGQALAKNPFPLIIPCHRAIRSDGSLGGFQGGPVMKRVLLEMEGVRFDEAGRVIAPQWFTGKGYL
jgi:methylated-DNA-[protein]-cysteine S-methyltransferase